MKRIIKTRYKNIIITILISGFIGLVTFCFSMIFFDFPTSYNQFSGFIMGLGSFFFIGRKIIVRHEVRNGNVVIIEFLLRPKHRIVLNPDEIKEIVYMDLNYGRYGRSTKGVIIYSGKDMKKRKFTLSNILKSELDWFKF